MVQQWYLESRCFMVFLVELLVLGVVATVPLSGSSLRAGQAPSEGLQL